MTRNEALDTLDATLAELGRKLTFPPVVTEPLVAQARAHVEALRSLEGPTLAQRVAALAAKGLGVREIARRLDENPGTVHRALKGVAKRNGDRHSDSPYYP